MTEKCIYCEKEFTVPEKVLPATDQSWEEVEKLGEHSPDCEWVLTRGHTRELTRCIE